jgi:hypothetical protein
MLSYFCKHALRMQTTYISKANRMLNVNSSCILRMTQIMLQWTAACTEARYWLLVAVLIVQFVPHRKHIPSP